MESLQGKVALVTGAGKGIGRAVALALAAEGVHVGLLARTDSDLQALAAEITAELRPGGQRGRMKHPEGSDEQT